MGSDKHYPEERPVHSVTVDGFWMDARPVTNARFARFVEATGHTTYAEIAPTLADYPEALPDMLYAGSLVFVQPAGKVDLGDFRNWWQYVRGADWRHPYGADSAIAGLEEHPVVHVTSGDAEAFAAWEGKAIPTEAEWEFAARGGLDGATYAWGSEFLPGDRRMANTWQAALPVAARLERRLRANLAGRHLSAQRLRLYDVIGNVWEWTADFYEPRHPADVVKACCIPRNPRGPKVEDSYDPCQTSMKIRARCSRRIALCAPNYCHAAAGRSLP